MSDRKYRQRGYQDDDRDRRRSGQAPGQPAKPAGPRERPEGPRTPNLMGYREVFRCTRCGNIESTDVGSQSTCAKCGVALHACIHCVSFDPGATFECRQPLTARVSPKDARNECTFFAPRRTVEKETGSTAPTSARKAFDDLFKL
jgi:hypothetical protein